MNIMINWLLYLVLELVEACERLNPFKKKFEPSLLAYNVVWFTNCSWLEQLYCFKELDQYLDKGKFCNE